MKLSAFFPHRKSIFIKFMLLLVIFGIIILFLALGAFRQFRPDRSHIFLETNIDRYLEYLTVNLGDPPSYSSARTLADELFLNFKYESPVDESWTTQSNLPPAVSLHTRTFQGQNYGWHKKNFFVIKEMPRGKLIIFTHFKNESRHALRISLVFIGLLIMVLLLLYYSIRRVLRPVPELLHGVQKVGDGEFSYEVPVTTHDELGTLSRAFNQMTKRIQSMLQSRKQLLLDVSHELRSPLTRMKVALELMPESSQKNRVMDDIRELNTMIQEILEEERLESGYGQLDKEDVNLTELLRECISSSTEPANIDFHSPAENIFFKADPKKLGTAVINLLNNALKYSQDSSRQVELTLKNDSTGTTIEVTDYGTGIKADDLDKIFIPFYRVDPSRSKDTGGYGLGLSLSKKIIEAHQGKITVASNFGERTCFRIELSG